METFTWWQTGVGGMKERAGAKTSKEWPTSAAISLPLRFPKLVPQMENGDPSSEYMGTHFLFKLWQVSIKTSFLFISEKYFIVGLCQNMPLPLLMDGHLGRSQLRAITSEVDLNILLHGFAWKHVFTHQLWSSCGQCWDCSEATLSNCLNNPQNPTPPCPYRLLVLAIFLISHLSTMSFAMVLICIP